MTNTPSNDKKNRVQPATQERCAWASGSKKEADRAIYEAYHDNEWGVPLHDDNRLFEMLVLESFQAGLSWLTVLKKRESFRQAFARFDATTLLHWGEKEINHLMQDTSIIRNRLKITAAINNARCFLDIQARYGSFDAYIWQFVDGIPVDNRRQSLQELPAQTPISEKMSKELAKHGFRFRGPTICYAFMQSTGMVNDHLVSCFRYKECMGHER